MKLQQLYKSHDGQVSQVDEPFFHFSSNALTVLLKVSFHPNGSYLISSSQDKTLIVFDLLEARPIFNLLSHKSAVNAVQFSPSEFGNFLSASFPITVP